MDLFQLLSQITLDPNCRAGCEGGQCPDLWYPGAHDICDANCGRVYEPFWDECGEYVLVTSFSMLLPFPLLSPHQSSAAVRILARVSLSD